LNINGYERGSIYAGGESFDMASVFSEISLQPSIEKSGALLKSDLRFRTGYFFNESQTNLQIKELYAGYRYEKIGFSLGNQIVNWGRTDGFNPTNNITPNDYFFLSADPNDQKLSNFLLKLNYRPVSGVNFELIGIPFDQMSNYRFDLFDMFDMSSIGNLGAIPGMSNITPNIVFGKDVMPDKEIKNASVAFRADFDFSAFGGSVSCLFIIRGEMAYNITKNGDNRTYIPNSDLSYVAGLEANVGDFMLLAQYIGKYTFDFKELTMPILTDPANPLAIMQFAGEMANYQFRGFNRKIFNQQEKRNQRRIAHCFKIVCL